MENIEYHVQDGIAHICLNRPEKLNSFSRQLIKDFHEALDLAEKDDYVRVIILSAKGSSFCTGGDLEMMAELTSSIETFDWMKEVSDLTIRLRTISKYIVAAVHGYSAGAGFSLALAADFIIADEEAKFTLSFSKVGLVPDLGLFKLLGERVPINLLKEWIAFGTVIQSRDLYKRDIVNRVVSGSVVEEAIKFSEYLVKGSPLSQQYSKSIINQLVHPQLVESISIENLHQTLLLQSQDHQEGISAFFEKRMPVFKGN